MHSYGEQKTMAVHTLQKSEPLCSPKQIPDPFAGENWSKSRGGLAFRLGPGSFILCVSLAKGKERILMAMGVLI